MSLVQPRTPLGTLEFLPRDQMRFQHMLDIIRQGYESFGFVPVETPVFEQRDVILTKSGGETEKQIYFVQSSGAHEQGKEPDLVMHFDLTVPLARYVAEHERDLAFPFRRYQMQRSYRGERPQRGREREFYQCDIDIIGKDKLDPAFDAELPAIVVSIFSKLGIEKFTIHFSNRKVLLGLLEANGIEEVEKQTLIVREIDKLDKIGADEVRKNIVALGLTEAQAETFMRLISMNDSKDAVLKALEDLNVSAALFQDGLKELHQMVAALRALGVPEERTRLNLAIARGLDYYTGTVYETLIDDHPEFGSVCSGGRYENLASFYTKSKLPGVGLSIGATRLFDQLKANGLLPESPNKVQVLIAQMDVAMQVDYLALGAELRRSGFNVDNYLEPAKLDKQLKYANKCEIPFVLLLGEDEKQKNAVLVKNMTKKEQTEVSRAELATFLHNALRV